jgi:hypothetical protein
MSSRCVGEVNGINLSGLHGILIVQCWHAECAVVGLLRVLLSAGHAECAVVGLLSVLLGLLKWAVLGFLKCAVLSVLACLDLGAVMVAQCSAYSTVSMVLLAVPMLGAVLAGLQPEP